MATCAGLYMLFSETLVEGASEAAVTFLVFLSVLFAAFLHSAWNAILKTGASKIAGMTMMTLLQGLLGLAAAMTMPMPNPHVWGWLIASAAFHSGYNLFLAFAYEQGDLSRVYPIARGAAPMMVMVFSVLVLSDVMATGEYLGILILGLGIAVMAKGAFTNGESRKLVPLAFGAAVMTAGYSIVDGLGARASGDAVQYVSWMFFLSAFVYVPCALALRGRACLPPERSYWLRGLIAALGSVGAYTIAVWAMTVAPIALVAALRESSILFAMLIGWILFKDRMDWQKAVAGGLIVAGIVFTRI